MQLSLQDIKDADMVSYLARLGIEPARISGADHWYCSPLREEKTPSFKVNTRLNRWYDFGIGKGGNLIDFGILYYQCSVGELLRKIRENDLSTIAPAPRMQPETPSQPVSKLRILQQKPLSSPALLAYLDKRGINPALAGRFCKQIHYELSGRSYHSIGFPNDSGGYELRNAYSKISSSPKDITCIDRGEKQVLIFEGFFDLLSYQTLQESRQLPSGDYVVLNSVALFERARPFIERHEQIQLLLDCDAAGKKLTSYARSLDGRYQDASSLYAPYKDINELLVSMDPKRAPHHTSKTIGLAGNL